MPNQKRIVANHGSFVSYTLAMECTEVWGSVRKRVRPDDQKVLPNSQLDYKEEELVLGDDVDPHFLKALLGAAEGDIKSFEVKYPDYDPENIVTVALSVLRANGVPNDKLKVGMILGRNLLRNKITVNGEQTDMEIIEIKRDGGKDYLILDGNDALRGLVVRYDLEINEVRDATAEDRLSMKGQ